MLLVALLTQILDLKAPHMGIFSTITLLILLPRRPLGHPMLLLHMGTHTHHTAILNITLTRLAQVNLSILHLSRHHL